MQKILNMKQSLKLDVLWRNQKVALFLLLGLTLHILSLFSPLSNKAVNNVFYVGVLLPVLLLTRGCHLRGLFKSNVVKVALIYGVYTSFMMATTLEPDKFKYWLYSLALILAFYHLTQRQLLEARLLSYCLAILVFAYATIHLFWFYVVEGKSINLRPWFYGWQLFVPTYLTAYLSVVSAVVVGYLLRQKQLYIAFGVLLALLAAFLLTQSRMGVLGILASTPFLIGMLVKERGVRLISVKWVVFCVLILAIVVSLYFYGMLDPLLQRGESYRPKIWKAAWADGVSCGLWLGCGYDYLFQVVTGYATQITEHSIYLSQFLRSGLIGLILMLALIVMTIAKGWKVQTPWLLGFVAGCACLTVEGQSLMAQPRAITQFLFWIPFCMIVVSDPRLAFNNNNCDRVNN